MPVFHSASSSFEPTRKDANVPNINTILKEDVFHFDCRVLPDTELGLVVEEMTEVSERIADRFGVEILVEEYLMNESPNPAAPNAPVVVALVQPIQEIYGMQTRLHGIGGQTVGTFFRKKGLPAAVWGKLLHLAHTLHEKISIDNLVGDAKVFARMMV